MVIALRNPIGPTAAGLHGFCKMGFNRVAKKQWDWSLGMDAEAAGGAFSDERCKKTQLQKSKNQMNAKRNPKCVLDILKEDHSEQKFVA